MLKKKNKLLSISDVALQLNLINKKNKKLATHTLRFWEKTFKQLKPTTLAGRRYYSVKDVEVIKMIIFLLREQCLTINGAKKIMNANLKQLDDTKSSSIKTEYYKEKIKKKTKDILYRIKKLNG
tara:strand:+ start:2658 stop:3029 length:372 start_codon:yes stop_codon:yes gene_type:complete